MSARLLDGTRFDGLMLEVAEVRAESARGIDYADKARARAVLEHLPIARDQWAIAFAGGGDQPTIDRIGKRRGRNQAGINRNLALEIQHLKPSALDRIPNPALDGHAEAQPPRRMERDDLEDRGNRDGDALIGLALRSREPPAGLRAELPAAIGCPDPDMRVEEHGLLVTAVDIPGPGHRIERRVESQDRSCHRPNRRLAGIVVTRHEPRHRPAVSRDDDFGARLFDPVDELETPRLEDGRPDLHRSFGPLCHDQNIMTIVIQKQGWPKAGIICTLILLEGVCLLTSH